MSLKYGFTKAVPVTSLAAAPAPQPSESLGQSTGDIFSQLADFIPLPRFAKKVSQEFAMQNEGMEHWVHKA
eukprot:CAMPEP_0195155976 /NCGR_PEP_ID=MMETSP0448-20130528/184427_1 /TAXON_ID=66468 /ORGANISM="Heterocapsa triquestra, Strain CCMP 448" /LENGTH=70 /DNA_ID=CAMNT_0040194765 /DNA_START=530 /DNA_END=742 /DNA_ORIENTATION=-